MPETAQAIPAKTAPAAPPPDLTKIKREFAVIRFPQKLRKIDPDIISVGVEGRKYRMKRNEFIPVPFEVIHALRNAKEPVPEPETSDGFSPQLRRRKVVDFSPRFPHEIVGWITRDAYERLRAIAKRRSLTEQEVYDAV